MVAVIAHEQRTIFIHIPKCAGQSVENAFLKINGLERKNRLPLLLTKNHQPAVGPPQLAHLLAKEYIQYHYLSKRLFYEYFKFSFVRNPWSRVVSFYTYSSYRSIYTFSQFMRHYFIPKMWEDKFYFVRPQVDYLLGDDGQVLVDFVGRFETLNEDFHFVCDRLGLYDLRLEHDNKSQHGLGQDNSFKTWFKQLLWVYGNLLPKYNNYRDYYDSKSIAIVERLYLADIEFFGYKF